MSTLDRDEVTRANEAYHDAIVDDYDVRGEGTDPFVLDQYRDLFNDYVLPRMPRDRPARCLDLGCGSGYMETFLPETYAIRGVDVSTKMLARAAERFPHCEWLRADLYEYEPEDGPFDLVMEKAVLHHLLDFETLVDKMARLTAPGGVLVIANEPNALAYRGLAPLKWLFRKTINRERGEMAESRLGDAEYEHIAEYHLFYGKGIDAFGLRKRLRGLGFTDVELMFSLRELFATLDDAWPKAKLNKRVPGLVADHFWLSRNFHLVATKAPF